MSGLTDFLGAGGIGRQFLIYGVGYELARSVLAPSLVAVQAKVWQDAVSSSNGDIRLPLSPADLAQMAIRGVYSESEAAPVASRSGVAPDDFRRLMLIAGEPPPLMLILELYRRGFIPWEAGPVPAISAQNAIREGRIRDEWIPVLQRAQFTPPAVAEAVNAVIRNQITYTEGIALAYYAGLGTASLAVPEGADTSDTATAFKVLVDTAGRPPAPTQLAELVHRGRIRVHGRGPTETTFEQGIYEGDLKDKWEAPLEAFLEVIPSIYEVRILQEHGAISNEQATTWLDQLGYTPDVAQALADNATAQAIITDRILTEANLKTLFENGTITEQQALSMLTQLGYPATAAKFIVASWTLDTQFKAYSASISRVGSYFIAHKLTPQQAATNLERLGVPQSQIAGTIEAWTVARTSNVRLLTESQIADAWFYGIMNQATAISELTALGYTPYDAWVVLSVKAKTPLPTQPARTTLAIA
jgi:hypothetical protein